MGTILCLPLRLLHRGYAHCSSQALWPISSCADPSHVPAVATSLAVGNVFKSRKALNFLETGTRLTDFCYSQRSKNLKETQCILENAHALDPAPLWVTSSRVGSAQMLLGLCLWVFKVIKTDLNREWNVHSCSVENKLGRPDSRIRLLVSGSETRITHRLFLSVKSL